MLSWNIEGWGRNCFNLLHFVDACLPDMVFLSEPQVFLSDIAALFSLFDGKFAFHQNSEDAFCPDIPLSTRRAKGGTMAMWASKLDPHVKILI